MPSLGAASAARAVHPSPTPSISHQFDEANLRNNARHIHWGAEEVFEDDAKAESEGADGTEVEEEQLSDGLVLAITAAKSKVACCYFDPASDKIFFLEDQQDSPEWDLTALGAKTAERKSAEHSLTCQTTQPSSNSHQSSCSHVLMPIPTSSKRSRRSSRPSHPTAPTLLHLAPMERLSASSTAPTATSTPEAARTLSIESTSPREGGTHLLRKKLSDPTRARRTTSKIATTLLSATLTTSAALVPSAGR